MSRIRVMVVDDSGTIRRLLVDVLSKDPELVVVATACDAATALEKIRETTPDVLTLDVEMPDRSGLELLVDIRRIAPRLPVIMFSSLTLRAAATTLEALARGATDYVTKPSGTSREAAIEHVKSQLVPKLKVLGGRAPVVTQSGARADSRRVPQGVVDLVAIGTSTGGPNALSDVFRELPASFPVPIVVVQHMPPMFTRLLAERLDATCPLAFSEATDGAAVVPGRVLIAPGDSHMRVVANNGALTIALDKEPPEHSCRPAVDVLFRSVATVTKSRSLAVVLTGMGQDGLLGCEAIRARDGQILVQDEATSVVWGMPGFVARAGIADRIVPLGEIARAIVARVGSRRLEATRVA